MSKFEGLKTVKIEKGIDIYGKFLKRGRTGARKSPVATMEVGESFLLPKAVGKVHMRSLYASLYNYQRKYNYKFTKRIVEEDRIRVWRVK